MKITSEDMDDVRDLTGCAVPNERRDIALALILVKIYDRGYKQGHDDASDHRRYAPGVCPFTHSHTREWCGYAGCRES
ncbi:MAG: hypothetical protein LC723_06415 [Actinobacteria bacterium]|nr:hypothetical protein [Actinomycetota bacterium]